MSVRIVRQHRGWCYVRPTNRVARQFKQSFPDFSVESDMTCCIRLRTDDDVRALEALIAPPI